ncbi:MAG: peptidylprolyl isomerase [Anaerolineales bacterium]|nr:peptidylprolyl isomerase [Anaerolineales bacterium]
MAKTTKKPIITKKHLARLEKEQIQRRYILILSLAIVVAVFGLIGYGLLDQYYLRDRKPVAIVNGEKITVKEFKSTVRYRRQQLIRSATQTYEFIQLFANSPDAQFSFISQLEQIQNSLTPMIIGQDMLDQIIDATIIRQEAHKRGITASDEEIDQTIREAFGYFPQGTPTMEPTQPAFATSTLSPAQLAMLRPTSTPTATAAVTVTETPTAIPSITPTLAPTPSPTEYTLEAFQTDYQATLDDLKLGIDFAESDLRKVVETQILSQKLSEAVLAEMDIAREQEQVWARHILVEDEQLAKDLRARLENGEDWYALAAEYSLDTANKDDGGDLGWFSLGDMVPQFEVAAFALKAGEISQPVQSEFGWHLIQVLGHETRPLSESAYDNLRQIKFQEWVTQAREGADIEIKPIWQEVVPEDPTLPDEIVQVIEYARSSQVTPEPVLPLETPATSP